MEEARGYKKRVKPERDKRKGEKRYRKLGEKKRLETEKGIKGREESNMMGCKTRTAGKRKVEAEGERARKKKSGKWEATQQE